MKQQGFTLIELLVVVLIIGILTSIALPQYRKAMDRAKATEVMQMLPALFEARERWLIEHQCQWGQDANSIGGIRCADGSTQTPGRLQLDIETKLRNGQGIGESNNFVYFLHPIEHRSGTHQPCVMAIPKWGTDRGIGVPPQMGCVRGGVHIFYGGGEFFCRDGATPGGCERLNITDNILEYDDSQRNGHC